MPNALILTEVQEAMRARYKQMLLDALSAIEDRRGRASHLGRSLHRRHRDPALLLPADGRPRRARCAQAEMDPGTRHGRRQHHRPPLARERGAGHQHPRHPRRADVGSDDRLHALARARHAEDGARATSPHLGALAGGAARRQDRRHSRRRRHRRTSRADAEGVQHAGHRHQRRAARSERLRPDGEPQGPAHRSRRNSTTSSC